MAFKKWVVASPEREAAKLIAAECEVDPFVALIAYGRGINDASYLEQFLSDEPILCDPFELADIRLAAQIVNEAIAAGEHIAVFGDYDCDGVVSTALLCDYLKSRGATVSAYIPDRIDEGYGMNIGAVDSLKASGVSLIVTVDNGISCAEEIAYANSLGMRVIVADHHIPPENLPDAAAVVDPHRRDCPSQFKEICGAVVTFKLVCAIDDKEPEQLLYRYADMLAIATVGDVMPLINENRSIVREGVKKLRHSPSVGVAAVLLSAGIDRTTISAGRISYGIVPRINAAGRMGNAMRAFELLTCEDTLAAIKIANELDECNADRQRIERDITSSAIAEIENKGYQYNRVIVVSGENWHAGVVGIVASRICEKYGKPAIVLSIADGVAHGSGRSFQGFHLYNAIHSCKDVLLKHGGHELAAGVSVLPENINSFRECINEYADNLPFQVPELHLDFKLNPSVMSVDMAYAIKALEPFGMGNPTPVFGVFGVQLQKITPIANGKHLRLLFSKENTTFQAMLFGTTEQEFIYNAGDTVDLAITLDTNTYRDTVNLSVQIKEIRLSGINETAVISDMSVFDSFMNATRIDAAALLPTREQVGAVYKAVDQNGISLQKIKFMFTHSIGYAKTQIAVKILHELGLVAFRGGKLYGTTAQKTDLNNSKTYSFLREQVNSSNG